MLAASNSPAFGGTADPETFDSLEPSNLGRLRSRRPSKPTKRKSTEVWIVPEARGPKEIPRIAIPGTATKDATGRPSHPAQTA